jgi:hypothetical protein
MSYCLADLGSERRLVDRAVGARVRPGRVGPGARRLPVVRQSSTAGSRWLRRAPASMRWPAAPALWRRLRGKLGASGGEARLQVGRLTPE